MALSPEDILDLPISERDTGATSIRDYLQKLLRTLWNEGEGFSGKRPFGNSGWQTELQVALIRAGLPFGTLDEDDYFEDDGPEDFDAFILRCIEAL